MRRDTGSRDNSARWLCRHRLTLNHSRPRHQVACDRLVRAFRSTSSFVWFVLYFVRVFVFVRESPVSLGRKTGCANNREGNDWCQVLNSVYIRQHDSCPGEGMWWGVNVVDTYFDSAPHATLGLILVLTLFLWPTLFGIQHGHALTTLRSGAIKGSAISW